MVISAEAHRSRTIRRHLLQMLDAAHRGNPDVGVDHEQMLDAFGGSRVRYPRAEIEAELIDLLDDSLVRQSPAPTDPLGKVYNITSPGRSFVRAGFPWEKVDEFDGTQNNRIG